MNNIKIIALFVVVTAVLGFSLATAVTQPVANQGGSTINAVAVASPSAISAGSNNASAQYSAFSAYVNSTGHNATKGTPGLLDGNNINSSFQNSVQKYLFLPNMKAIGNISMQDGTVHPYYSVAPAPMGIGDFGLMNTTGEQVGYNLSSSSFEGSVTINSLDPLYMLNDAPNNVSIQLNTVLNNVTLFGNSTYSFWTQNVIMYDASTHTLQFEDNIWNFSAPSAMMSSNAIYNSTGQVYPYPGVHIAIGPTFQVNQPFTVNLYLNSTIIDNRNTVYFNYSIPQISKSGTYDRVEFNSTYGVSPSVVTPQANFLVSGTTLAPIGLLYDAELMIGGPGGGSTTDFQSINVNMTLNYLNSTTSKYTSVPSAYNFGTDTGETSSGAAVYWTTNYVAHLTTGPSILDPMWGNSAAESGYFTLSGALEPSNGFIFINPSKTVNNLTAQWAPLPINGKFSYKLSPGSYSLQALASDYDPVYIDDISAGAGAVISESPIVMVFSSSVGAYAPLYAFSNQQLQNITVSGSGTASNPYNLINQNESIDPVFGGLNDFYFPVFNGILLYNTTDYVSDVGEQPEVMQIYMGYDIGYEPMQLSFYEAQNVSLLGMDITGFLYPAYDGFIAAEINFWYSSNDIVSTTYFFYTYVGLSSAYGNDITVANSYFEFSSMYSVYGNTIVANTLFDSPYSELEDYYANDTVIGNVFNAAYEFVENSTVNMVGNIFLSSSNYDYYGYSAVFEAVNSTITGYSNSFNSAEYYSLNTDQSMTDSSFSLSLVLELFGNNAQTDANLTNTNVLAENSNIYMNQSTEAGSYIETSGGSYTVNGGMISGSYIETSGGSYTVNGGMISESEVYGTSTNLSLVNTDSTYAEVAEYMGNLTINGVLAQGILMETYLANVSVASSTFTTAPEIYYLDGTTFPWFVVSYYGTNNYHNDLIETSDYYNSGDVFSAMGIEIGVNVNDVTFVLGNNTVTHTTFYTVNSNQASDLVIEYGNNVVTGNTFKSIDVSLNNNVIGYGSSLIVYGGNNQISNNKFITINSPAPSVFLMYGDVATQSGNEYLYSVSFDALNLPSNTTWNLVVNGTSYTTQNSSYDLLLSPGTYSYSASSPGYNSMSGTFTVTSSSIVVSLPFVAEPEYTVAFVESGLPSGTTWSVSFNGVAHSSNTSTIAFLAYNGTFDYNVHGINGYIANNVSGAITVDGSAVSQNVNWNVRTYAVTVEEQGLETGTNWGLSVNGHVYTSTADSMVIYLPNGTYSYSLMSINGFVPSEYSGSFVVSGSTDTIQVQYTQNEYSVEFIESGLSTGTTWSVTMGNVTLTTNNTYIVFSGLTNGVYHYNFSSVKGYVTPSSGSVTISNSGATVTGVFAKQTVPPAISPEVAGVISGVGAGVLAAAGIGFVLRRK